MDISDEAKNQMVSIAQESFSQFESIARAAPQALHNTAGAGPGAFAAINTLTHGAAVQRLTAISRETVRASTH